MVPFANKNSFLSIMNQRTQNYLALFVERLQSQGRYSFTLAELRRAFELSDEALKKALHRLVRKQKIAPVRQGFYVVVPPEYLATGILPPHLFIDDLMKFLGKPYYVGLLSAAALHGAGHQQPQEFYVVTTKPAHRPIESRGVKINFPIKAALSKFGLEDRKTDTGYLKVSSPELTAIDLVQFESRVGGLNRVTTVLDELADRMEVASLQRLANKEFPAAHLQRLGFILDEVLQREELAQAIFEGCSIRRFHRVPLNPTMKKNGFGARNRWKIIANASLESEL